MDIWINQSWTHLSCVKTCILFHLQNHAIAWLCHDRIRIALRLGLQTHSVIRISTRRYHSIYNRDHKNHWIPRRVVIISHYSITQVSGDDCNKRKKHDEWGYASMFLHHISDLKMLVSKSGRQPFAQEAPWVTQVSPKGPKFWSQNFSHTIPRWCVFMRFFKLLSENQSLFSDLGAKSCNIAIL